jgi:hypothetical protein
MKRKSSKPPAATIKPQEGLKSPTARVSIREVAPTPDQIEKWIKGDPARLSGFVRQSVKQSARLIEAKPLFRAAEKRAAAVGPRNELAKQDAKARRQKIREVARELRRTTRKRLQTELSKRGLFVSIKTISRALNPKQ